MFSSDQVKARPGSAREGLTEDELVCPVPFSSLLLPHLLFSSMLRLQLWCSALGGCGTAFLHPHLNGSTPVSVLSSCVAQRNRNTE